MRSFLTQTVLLVTVLSLLACGKSSSSGTTTGGGSSGGGSGSSGGQLSITISLASELNAIGKVVQAAATVKDANGTVQNGKTITWTATDNKIISVNAQGLVTVIGIGTTELIASTDNNSVSGRLTVVVGANRNAVTSELGCLCDPAEFPATGTVSFTAPIMKAEDLSYILPLGYMFKGHVTPIDHQYYYPPDIIGAAPQKAVYAPADGYIVKVYRSGQNQVESQLAPRDNYSILIQHSCDTYTYLSLITGLTTEMANAIGAVAQGGYKDLHLKVTAGQQLAWIAGQSLDVNVYNLSTPAKNWVVPSHYTEAAKRFATDPFLFYTPAIRTALQAKTIRTGDPIGGRFDYDEDGKLVGTWFLQGTNGYAGAPNLGNDYWRGHLTFAYYVHNTSFLEVSIGRWNKPGATDAQIKEGWQFAVVGNTPDPKNITPASGLVKYELVDPEFVLAGNPNQPWDRQTFQGALNISTTNRSVEGVLLVQMMETRIIKVEAFPGKRASEVSGFTSNAQLYER
jgi:hypothetical protein